MTVIQATGNLDYWLMAFWTIAAVEMAQLFIPDVSGLTDVYTLLSSLVMGTLVGFEAALQSAINVIGWVSVTGAIFALMDSVAMIYYIGVYFSLT